MHKVPIDTMQTVDSVAPGKQSASGWLIGLRVVLPQVLPRLLTSLRLQLGPAFLFLNAAEAISAEAGLGYRIWKT